MIQANELRIGNWVKVYDDHTTMCKGIELDRFVFTNKNFADDAAPLREVAPIPITPDILANCGLLEKAWIKTYTLVSLIKTPQGYDVITKGDEKIAALKYVHQLQNLYFALTGQELEIHW